MACVDSTVIGKSRPGFCDSTNLPISTGCPVFDSAVQSIDAGSNGRKVAVLADCQTVLASQTVPAKFGIQSINMSNGWPGQQVDTDVQNCKRTRYGVYDSTTGQPSTYGGTKLSSAWSMWPAIKQVCQTAMKDAKYKNTLPGQNTPLDDFNGMFSQQDGPDDTTVNVAFDYNCQSPDQTWYTKCRAPGFDYITWDSKLGQKVDQYGQVCAKDPNNINPTSAKSGIPAGYFSGAQATQSSSAGKTKDTCDTGGCCIQVTTTDASQLDSRTCQTCQSSQTSTLPSLTGKNVTFYLTDYDGSHNSTRIDLPYCDSATQKGVAITPNLSASNAQYFSDVRECQPGGSMAGQCNGITGCQGLNDSYNDCMAGMSNFSTFNNPSTNCPNYMTLARQAASANTCPATGTSFDTSPYVTSGAFINSMSGMQIPEGAWVTLWATGDVNLDDQLCAPPASGQTKFMLQLMCGQSTTGTSTSAACDQGTSSRLRADAKLFQVTSSSATNITPKENLFISSPPTSKTGCFCEFQNLDAHSLQSAAAGVPDPQGAAQRGWQGVTMGFMPGYYDTTCTTSKGACN